MLSMTLVLSFELLRTYDSYGCARECNNRDPDPLGGGCKYINIWAARVANKTVTYVCELVSY
jgi:hypothetical protein